jgi:hypothetical protein
MNRFILNILLISCALFISINRTKGQTMYFPVDGKSTDDFTSSFGPRNLSLNSNEYPQSGYDYDFHAGIDISGTAWTNVYPIYNSYIVDMGSSWITIKPVGWTNVYYKYQHIYIESGLSIGNYVAGGSTVLGQTDNGNHLDFRFLIKPTAHADYVDNWDWGVNDYNAYNPAYDLVENNTTIPLIVDEYGSPISSMSYIDIDEDNGTLHGNQQGGYFVIGARSEDDELDIDKITVLLEGTDDNNNRYYEDELLLPTNTTDHPQWPHRVWYDLRYNCGDLDGNDSDIGHNSESVGIYPKILTSDHHTVYFRWYINETNWYNMASIFVDIEVEDVAGNIARANNISFATCIDCYPPDEAPDAPTLSSVSYQDTGKVNLIWQSAQTGEPADFFRIYRCFASESMTDNDAIGIAAATSYLDDDPDLISNYSYKYAVAGVNLEGEGYNSNEISITLPCYTKNIIDKIYMGNIVEKGCRFSIENVEIKSGANVKFDADESVIIESDFEVEIGAILEIV